MEDIKIYNLNQPPRFIPFSVHLRILFGSFLNQFGWGFLALGLCGVWLISFNSEMKYINHFRGKLGQTSATIIGVKATNVKVDKTRIYEYHYRFEVNGTVYEDVAYLGGAYVRISSKKTGSVSRVFHGEKRPVEYEESNPSMSRIPGMRKALFPLWLGIFMNLFPLVGAIMVLFGFTRGLKQTSLLKYGETAIATLKSKEATGAQINNRQVFKFTFEFSVHGQTYCAIAKSHICELFEDARGKMVLFDSINPSQCVVLDNLPGVPKIDDLGTIMPKSLLSTSAVMLLPMLTIVGHGSYMYLQFFSIR